MPFSYSVGSAEEQIVEFIGFQYKDVSKLKKNKVDAWMFDIERQSYEPK